MFKGVFQGAFIALASRTEVGLPIMRRKEEWFRLFLTENIYLYGRRNEKHCSGTGTHPEIIVESFRERDVGQLKSALPSELELEAGFLPDVGFVWDVYTSPIVPRSPPMKVRRAAMSPVVGAVGTARSRRQSLTWELILDRSGCKYAAQIDRKCPRPSGHH